MKLAENNEQIAQYKLLILYILNKINKPLNSDELLKLVLTTTDMNYFYFQQFLLDLLENRYIINYNENSSSIYSITEEGKKALSLTENMIPGILKFKVDSNVKDNLSDIQDELSVTAEFIPESESQYYVRCKIVDNNKVLIDLNIYAGSRVQANNIVNNWEKNANKLYPDIFKILAEDNSDI